MLVEDCPFCGKKHEHVLKCSLYIEIVCDTCGAVVLTTKALEQINNNEKKKYQLIHLLHEKNIKDRLDLDINRETVAKDETKEALLTKKILLIADKNDTAVQLPFPQYTLANYLAQYPRTVTDKLNRTLCNIARIKSLPSSFIIDVEAPLESFWSTKDRDKQYIKEMLIESGLCCYSHDQSIDKSKRPIIPTTKGWKKFEELEINWQISTTAFVAMWFSKATLKYRDAVKEAMRLAGYEPKIIDDHEHNNFIMDEVINQINEAKFVVADFTCIPEQPENNSKIPGGVRGGVYFEAGYAKGLGKEVIVTCRDDADSKKRRHFDIDQLNTLFWSEKDGVLYDCNGNDFTHRLAERIKATVGKGKLIN